MTDHPGFHHPVSDPEYLAECAHPASRRRLSLVKDVGGVRRHPDNFSALHFSRRLSYSYRWLKHR